MNCPNTDLEMCVIRCSHFPGSSLVLVGIGCCHLKSYLLCFLEKSLPAGSLAEPGTSTPVRLCTLMVLAASVPLLVWLSLWPPIMFPFTLIFFFFFYSCRQHHPASRAARASGSQQQHLQGLLWPPGECGGRRAEKSTWIGGKGEGVI